MINTQSTAAGSAAAALASDRRLYLAGGIGGVVAAVSWAVQPFLVVVVAAAEEDEYPTVAYLLANPWYGPVEAAVFTGIGVGLLFLVTSAGTLAVRRAGTVSPSARVGQVLGIFSGCAWVLLAGWYVGPFTSVGESIGEAVPDVAMQQAVLHIHNVGTTGIVMAASLSFAGWLIGVATVGRAHGVVGWPLAIAAAAVVIAMVLPILMPFSPPWGAVAGQLYALALGIAFLVKARRAP